MEGHTQGWWARLKTSLMTLNHCNRAKEFFDSVSSSTIRCSSILPPTTFGLGFLSVRPIVLWWRWKSVLSLSPLAPAVTTQFTSMLYFLVKSTRRRSSNWLIQHGCFRLLWKCQLTWVCNTSNRTRLHLKHCFIVNVHLLALPDYERHTGLLMF